MNNKMKIIVSAFLVVVVISLLWLVIPATPIWIISYIFALLATVGIAASFSVYKGKKTGVPQGHAFPVASATYAIISVLFSAVTVGFDYNGTHFPSIWYAIIHAAIFVFFIIRTIALFAGAEHIDKVGKNAEERHKELNKDKESYWK